MSLHRFLLASGLVVLSVLTGCATPAPEYDYTAFMKAKPASLLVLPPINESPDIKATPGVWAQATLPLSEAGYYVLPVTLVDQTFHENGVHSAHDAQNLPLEKLRDVFGADAAVYLKVTEYGTSYAIVSSETRVVVEARIIDLRSGELLWTGRGAASSAEQRSGNSGGLLGMLVEAAVKQIVGTLKDESYDYAGVANQRVFSVDRRNGVLPGPRSPLHGRPPGHE